MTMMQRKIGALIVDDEKLARNRIRNLLEAWPRVEIRGEAADGMHAADLLLNNKYDLVFLDVQMPGMTGFEVIDLIGAGKMPKIIFVTAYDQYAVKAFEVNAVDYLLKPFDRERFARSLERAIDEIDARNISAQVEKMNLIIDRMPNSEARSKKMLIKSPDRINIIAVEQITSVEAAGNYVRINTMRDNYMIRETMANMENRLKGRTFARIHRSTIINTEFIKELKPHFGGDYVVLMKDNKRFVVSRRYRKNLQRLIGKF